MRPDYKWINMQLSFPKYCLGIVTVLMVLVAKDCWIRDKHRIPPRWCEKRCLSVNFNCTFNSKWDNLSTAARATVYLSYSFLICTSMESVDKNLFEAKGWGLNAIVEIMIQYVHSKQDNYKIYIPILSKYFYWYNSLTSVQPFEKFKESHSPPELYDPTCYESYECHRLRFFWRRRHRQQFLKIWLSRCDEVQRRIIFKQRTRTFIWINTQWCFVVPVNPCCI